MIYYLIEHAETCYEIVSDRTIYGNEVLLFARGEFNRELVQLEIFITARFRILTVFSLF